jgi:hypothetical protein
MPRFGVTTSESEATVAGDYRFESVDIYTEGGRYASCLLSLEVRRLHRKRKLAETRRLPEILPASISSIYEVPM